MVAHLLRLKLAVLANSFRRPRRQAIGMAVAVAAAVVLTVTLAVMLGSLATAPVDDARAVVVVIGSLVVLGFAVLPLAFGADDQLDPSRFRWLGVAPAALAARLAVAALLSLPVAGVVLVGVGMVVALGRGPGPVAVTILGLLIALATCVLAGRVGAAIAALWLWSRRARDLVGMIVLGAVAVVTVLLAVLLSLDWESHALPIVRRIAAVAEWTPLGAAWAFPAEVASGRVGHAVGTAVIAVAVLALLAGVWRYLVARSLVARRRTETVRRSLGLGWFETLPASPWGVVAARSLSYWGRDARYLVQLAIVPIVPVVMVCALLVAGVPAFTVAWVPLPVMCLFLGWMVHNDVALDSSAFWLHLSTSTAGRADRWGRVVPPLVIGVPLILVGSVVAGIIVGHPLVALPIAGISACALLGSLGAASVTSALAPYPTVHPGESPFAQPTVSGPGGSVAQTIAFGAPVLLCVPVVLLGAAAVTNLGLAFATLGVGLALGIAVLLAGVAWGGSVIDRRSPEILELVLRS